MLYKFKKLLDDLMQAQAKTIELNELCSKLNIPITKVNVFKPSLLSCSITHLNEYDLNEFFIELIEIKPEIIKDVILGDYKSSINRAKFMVGEERITDFPNMELTEKCINYLTENDPIKLRDMIIKNTYMVRYNTLDILIDRCPDIFKDVKINPLLELSLYTEFAPEISGYVKLSLIIVEKIKQLQYKKIEKINLINFNKFIKTY